ncbi:hypothetical protein SteCoe_16845 [Stentor coeruleus]|uniref:Uncharacterized protein n=1 Tax=Stentor coeruleus TaxID=5963 RepID=A0A1R2C0C4_9CILI|nr:hypothetical protein SteCoe_16845 [Stentor coeruleus]
MNDSEKSYVRSISPIVMRSLSTTRATSRMPNYDKVRKHINAISKSVFKTEVNQHPILSLEKAVLRGTGTEKFLSKPRKSPMPVLTKLEVLLKKEHKINSSGKQIVKLPKLPFGQHHTYNEELVFVDKHFVHERSESLQIQELRDLSRKFKLGERIRSKRNHSKLKANLKTKCNKEVYDMEGGKLIVNIENEAIKSYEADKSKYIVKHHYAYQTFRKVILNSSPQIVRKNTLEKIKIANSMLKRLYKTPEKNVGELERQLTMRYPALFVN